MKKCLLFAWLFLAILAQTYGQDARKKLDLIIVIDDNIAVGSIVSLQIEFTSGKTKEVIPASYYPGNLSIAENDYSKLMSDSTKAIDLKFTHYEYIGANQKAYNYEIEIKREWLEDYFNILRIYDLNNEKYKRKYSPNSVGKNYVFEIESPSHSFRLVEKK